MKRLFLLFFIGFMIGIFSKIVPQTDWSIENFAEPLVFILATITIFLNILTVAYIIKIKQKAKMIVTGEEEDRREEWLYKKYYELYLLSISGFIFAFTTSTFIVGTDYNYNTPLMLLITTLMFPSFFITFLSFKLEKVVYKNREIPSPTEKNYLKKMLDLADEGERYIAFKGLYTAFNWINILLVVSIFLLSVYWRVTGDTQFFAILLIAIVMIIGNASYLLKVRKMY